MINDKHILKLYDHINAKDCFENVDIKGGVCYFLWNKNKEDLCDIHTYTLSGEFTSKRYLVESGDDIYVRDNRMISIKNKVSLLNEPSFDNLVSSNKPYGLRGDVFKDPSKYHLPSFSDKKIDDGYSVLGLDENQRRIIKYIDKNWPLPKRDMLEDFKIFITRNYGSGEVGECPASPVLASPGVVCTETFIQIGPFTSKQPAQNVLKYMKTKFFRLMVSIRKQDQGASRSVYRLVPMQQFENNSEIDWSKSIHEIDKQLYEKYSLSNADINFIESVIKDAE